MVNEPKDGAAVAPSPSPSLPAKSSSKRDQAPAYSATEDTTKDTATLVKEDYDVWCMPPAP